MEMKPDVAAKPAGCRMCDSQHTYATHIRHIKRRHPWTWWKVGRRRWWHLRTYKPGSRFANGGWWTRGH